MAPRSSALNSSRSSALNSKKNNAEAQARRVRELLWKDRTAWEDTICEPYLTVHNASPEQRLEILLQRSETILNTNVDLQRQTSEHEADLKRLRAEYEEKSKSWESVQEKLRLNKASEAQAHTNLRELKEARLVEEQGFRDKTVALHDKLTVLKERQRRLEETRREDEIRIARNNDTLAELRSAQDNLDLQKTEFDFAGGLDPVRVAFRTSDDDGHDRAGDGATRKQSMKSMESLESWHPPVTRPRGSLEEDPLLETGSSTTSMLRGVTLVQPSRPEAPREGKIRPSPVISLATSSLVGGRASK